MRIADGVEALEIKSKLLGEVRVIYPTLLWDMSSIILVDTGYPGQLPLFKEALEKAGVTAQRINRIVITHQDVDHIGSLPAFLSEAPHKIEVLAGEIEKPYIQGEKTLVKITPEVLAQLDSWPEEYSKPLRRLLENPPKAPVDTLIADGEELPYCGGIQVILTPGHTPGHTSLYHKPSKTLIAADALRVENGKLLGPEPQHSSDIHQAFQSLKKLADYDIETVICYHGGVYTEDANERIAQLANTSL